MLNVTLTQISMMASIQILNLLILDSRKPWFFTVTEEFRTKNTAFSANINISAMPNGAILIVVHKVYLIILVKDELLMVVVSRANYESDIVNF